VLGTIVGLAEILAVVLVVDRLLLAAEDRGWVNYRRKGPNLGAARYHVLDTHQVFEPGAEMLQEAKAADVVEEDETGDPPVDPDVTPGDGAS